MSIFSNFLKLHFSSLKSILFYPEYEKIFLSGFFWSTKKKLRKGRFFDKNHGLTPLQTVHFFEFFRTSLFRSKKHSFLSRISKNVSFWLFLVKKKEEKGRFFDKNHGLTPLQNVDFFRLCENFSFEVQKALFSIQNIKICLFLALFAQKKHIRRRSNFCQKPWTNPFAKCPFF